NKFFGRDFIPSLPKAAMLLVKVVSSAAVTTLSAVPTISATCWAIFGSALTSFKYSAGCAVTGKNSDQNRADGGLRPEDFANYVTIKNQRGINKVAIVVTRCEKGIFLD
ncbi:MAG: hypothetical protein P8X63_15515, partial [Desulfuromonadaceae bacterium]